MVSGACLCGELRYEVSGSLERVTHCHCSLCRKHHGAPFASMAAVAQTDVQWLSGESSVGEYRSSPGRVRGFCRSCGSVAPTPHRGGMLVPLGNLVGEPAKVAAGVHVFVGSKAPWHIIADDRPQFDTVPPGDSVDEVEPNPLVVVEGAVHGSCPCGGVTFSVTGAPVRWMQCHCSRCRRCRSAAHGSNTFFAPSQFAWLSGRELVRSYRPPEALRFAAAFCTRCGGGAPVEREGVPFVLVPASLLDGDLGLRPQAHIHVASKASWYTLADELPQFAELPPA